MEEDVKEMVLRALNRTVMTHGEKRLVYDAVNSTADVAELVLDFLLRKKAKKNSYSNDPGEERFLAKIFELASLKREMHALEESGDGEQQDEKRFQEYTRICRIESDILKELDEKKGVREREREREKFSGIDLVD